MADHVAIALDVIDAFNARDLERVLGHLHPDYEATWPHGHLEGAAAAAHEAAILAAFPDVQLVVVRGTPTDDGALLEVRVQGTHEQQWVAPDGEILAASHRQIDTPLAMVMIFDGSQIRSERLYFDQQTLHGQMRPIPAVSGR